jgi:hypothetical protein
MSGMQGGLRGTIGEIESGERLTGGKYTIKEKKGLMHGERRRYRADCGGREGMHRKR